MTLSHTLDPLWDVPQYSCPSFQFSSKARPFCGPNPRR